MGNHTLYIAITLSSIYIYGFRYLKFLRNGRFPTNNLHFCIIGISKLKTHFEGSENFREICKNLEFSDKTLDFWKNNFLQNIILVKNPNYETNFETSILKILKF